ncbi:MAG: hypothetical protein ACRDGA_14010, partial [Bacteroidota bacterium]
LQLSGDVSVTIPDTDDPSFTQFAVTASDSRVGGAFGPVTIKIAVTSQNGNTSYSFGGEVKEAQGIIQPPPSALTPAQIAFISVTASDIFVAGVGALENSVLTYEVRDSLGVAIDQTRRAYALYSLEFYPNTFVSGGTAPRLIPSADSTDDNGRLRVSLNSGTRSGVVQVVVTINTPGGVIRSQPVRVSINSGFPDQRHFTIGAPRYNFPGLEFNNTRLSIIVQVADRYSNPVQNGTAVYFGTHHGSVQTQNALTGADGFVTKELISGNPRPEGIDAEPVLGPGYSYVVAQTIGENGARVADSILVLWTGQPVLTKTDAITSFNISNGGSAGPFTFTVADKYGHPMSAGTTITVTAPSLTVSGNGASVTMFDTFATGPGITSFTVTVSDADPSSTASPPNQSQVLVTVTHSVYGQRTLILATGTVQ